MSFYPWMICLFCGRSWDKIALVRANLRAQPGLWACTDHVRQDGFTSVPHTEPPFDAAPPLIVTPLKVLR